MNDTDAAPQQAIFHEPLDVTECSAIEALVANHQANVVVTQQLALDASRLITTSQERLAKQSDTGFFMRFFSAVSGKTRENQLLNQVDMLKMQKYAWHYLQQLQQQNLITAQSIAVIRNNLGTLTDYVIETRDFLERAVERINNRLREVENNARLTDWSVKIEANKRSYRSLPSARRVLELTYDFLRRHNDVPLTSTGTNHLLVTLENVGINCDEEVRVLDLIVDLIYQIETIGVDRYRSTIELSFDGHVIGSDFIQKNVSAVGFNTLYYLADQYERIAGLLDHEVCNSDKVREEIISRFFGAEFSGLSAKYVLRDFVAEMVACARLSVDLYKEINGFNAPYESLSEESEPEPESISLVSSLPDIHSHSVLDSLASQESRREYVWSLGLCLDDPASIGRAGQEFIALLAVKAGCPELGERFRDRAPGPQARQEGMQTLLTLLNDTDKIYAWLLDAFFLLTLERADIHTSPVSRILDTLKPDQFRDVLPKLLTIITASDPAQVLDAAAHLVGLTHGWQNVIHYRALGLEDAFAEVTRNLQNANHAIFALDMELHEVSMKALDCRYYVDMSFEDDGILDKLRNAAASSACAMGRKSAVASLNALRAKSRSVISERSGALYQANSQSARWNIDQIDFDNQIPHSDFDLDNSAQNEDWDAQFDHICRQVEDSFSSFSRACEASAAQMKLFAKGEFSESVLEIRKREKVERLRQRQQEDLEKRTVAVSVDGVEGSFTVEWHDVDNPPCDPELIRYIKTDGKVWLIVGADGVCYRSEDRDHWEKVLPFGEEDRSDARSVEVVNGAWIISCYEGFCFSFDARSWQRVSTSELNPPSDGRWTEQFSSTDNVVHFNGLWLWRLDRWKEYQYTEKGLIFDSTETSNYRESVLFAAKNLGDPWKPWEDTPRLPEGCEIKCIRALPGTASLLAFCEYESSYVRQKKKTDASSFVKYYLAGKGWRTCTWHGNSSGYSEPVVMRMGSRLFCFLGYPNECLSSEKGFEWSPYDVDVQPNGCFPLNGLTLFPSRGDRGIVHVSDEGGSFKELTFEEGSWNHFCANVQGALCVYAPNRHETFLRAGEFNFVPKVEQGPHQSVTGKEG